MITLSAIIAFCIANKESFGQLLGGLVVIATVLNKLIPENVGPGWLHAILGRVSMFDKSGKLSLPLAEGNEKMRPISKLTPLIALLMVGFLTACSFCKAPANYNTLECKAYRAFSQCGPGVAEFIISDLATIIAGDVSKLLADVMQNFPQSYQCVSDAIKNAIAAKYGEGSVQYQRYLKADQAVRAAHAHK